MADSTKFTTVDEYIASQPAEVQEILHKIRATIRETAPDAHERIGYNMPAYYYNGYLIYFAANKKHIGLYPKTAAVESIEELKGYKGTKGSVHIPLNQPIPYDLIAKMVRVRLGEMLKK